MTQIFVNNSATVTAGGIGASDLTIPVADTTTFPAISGSDYTYITIEANGVHEIIKIVAPGKDTSSGAGRLTVAPGGRGQEGTGPSGVTGVGQTFSSLGARVEGRITAGTLASFALLDSPAFINTPTAPTAPSTTSDTQLATTAFVHNVVAIGGGGGGSGGGTNVNGRWTPTTPTSVFTITFTVGYLDVFVNGILLDRATDYTEDSSGAFFTLTTPVTSPSIVYAECHTSTVGPSGSSITGPSGNSVATATVFQWNTSTPSISGGGQYYHWATGLVTGTPPTGGSGWTATPGAPTPGFTLYSANVQVTDPPGTSDTLIPSWSGASIYPIGAAGAAGTSGSGSSTIAYTAYCLSTVPTVGSTANQSYSGDYPVPTTTNPWGLSEIGATWYAYPPTPTAGQYVYMCQGVYDGVSTTTFTAPFWATLKVGELSAISANMGSLTSGVINLTGGGDYIHSGQNSFNQAGQTGFWLSGGSTPQFSIGQGSGGAHWLTWDGFKLAYSGSVSLIPFRIRTISTSGTYTPAPEVLSFLACVSGSTSDTSDGTTTANGTGGGGYSEKYYPTPSGSYTLVIGARNGGVTYFDTSGYNVYVTGATISGGVGHNGDFNATGGNGGTGVVGISPDLNGNGGGGGGAGRGGNGGNGGNNTGGGAGSYGGGGGTGSNDASANNSGGSWGTIGGSAATSVASGAHPIPLIDNNCFFHSGQNGHSVFSPTASPAGTGTGASGSQISTVSSAPNLSGGNPGMEGFGQAVAGSPGFIQIVEFL